MKMPTGSTLYNFLYENQADIDFVTLSFIWKNVTYIASDNSLVAEDGEPLYPVIVADVIDMEYSYHGDVAGALVFAMEQSAWDYDDDITFEDGVVSGIQEMRPHDDYYDLADMERYAFNVSYEGLAYFRTRDKWSYYQGQAYPREGY